MPRTCSVCRNPRRDSINEALLTGQSLRNVAERFGTSVTSLHRHRKEIPKKIVKATEARDIVLGDTLLSQVQGLIEKAVAILERAEASGDDRCALQAVREVRETLHLLGKITGELEPKLAASQWRPMFILPPNAQLSWREEGSIYAAGIHRRRLSTIHRIYVRRKGKNKDVLRARNQSHPRLRSAGERTARPVDGRRDYWLRDAASIERTQG